MNLIFFVAVATIVQLPVPVPSDTQTQNIGVLIILSAGFEGTQLKAIALKQLAAVMRGCGWQPSRAILRGLTCYNNEKRREEYLSTAFKG